MKTFRLLATSLLVALSMGFTSCGDDELDVTPAPPINNIEDESTQRDKMFDEYIGDYSNITCRFCQAGESSILFTGLKNKHLWFAEYETATRGIKFEWTDIEETDTIQKVYKGYGEYETIKLDNIFPLFHKKTTAGNIVTLALNGYRQNIFTFNGRTKRNQLQSDPNKNKVAYSWFQESVFIGNCCYSSEGDTVYVAMKQPEFDSHGMPAETELISYEEGIRFLTGYLEDVSAENISISKYNYKDAKSVWVTRIVPPFDVTSDAKRVLTLTGNTTNIWNYKCEVTFYDGTKKDFTFKINIDNGKIVTDEVKVTGISINEQSVSLKQGETFQLIATVQPDNATNKEVIWSSSNEAVASVNQDGLITANSVGEANITVTTEDSGFSTTSIVIVTKKQDDYTSLIIGKWKMTSGDAVATHVTYKGDGTFEYTSAEVSSYKEVGKYKIDGNKLYEMYSDEDEWAISDILLLNSMTLSVQELEADGVTPSGKKFSYQRVE